MAHIQLSRQVKIPDRLKISRYQKVPELGPRLLFFSGGSALNSLSRVLKGFTHNSIHLVTPFDSGGSSAKLRQAFQMPAIGDLRSRMTALADESVTGHPEIFQLFTHRFSQNREQPRLLAQLEAMVEGSDPLVSEIANPMRKLICNQLGYFLQAMPADFNLHGASIGNLILAGGYLNNHEHLDPIIFLFSKLVNVQGTVRATVNDNLHLLAELDTGERICGQHRITGKEVAPLRSPIRRLQLCAGLNDPAPAEARLRKKVRRLIASAELICYPPGSFYSSLMANLLPQGVGRAIAESGAPKVYIPNLGQDPEQLGLDLDRQIQRLLAQLQADAAKAEAAQLLNFVLFDSSRGNYPGRLSRQRLHRLGIQLIDMELISKTSAPCYDNQLLVQALLSLT
ncbi:MAG: GAK system CofD-like protein [Gammaproteobacteria bacterium SHHR-1]|uniref:GAK system CofD-like protein n=1 Tax=Magnetovirga frankeli TaxID=947516 RepID=UPI0012934814|nr:GAK system CofD-like protein [gamma proteobacterium SS-5]